jgi:tetratricopeptide (TPR) repeat protein
MNRVRTIHGREFTIGSVRTFDGRARHGGRRARAWVTVGAFALGTMLALGPSPAAARPSLPAAALGGSSEASPLNGAIFADDLDAAERLTGLGERYVEQSALADAEAAFRGALAIVEAAVGPTDPRLAGSMTALADVRAQRGDFTGAETLYRRALAIVERAYGATDPRVVVPLGNLAGLYRTRERWADAAPLYLRLARLFERILGADDFHVALTLDHVAESYAAQGRYAEADEFYGRVLAILEPRLGSDHRLVLQVRAERDRARRQLEPNGQKKG